MLERLRSCLPEGQTCSAGVCRWDGAESAESLTSRADTALYAAKDAGRDRIIGV
jgi:PleD family two-component response regulator